MRDAEEVLTHTQAGRSIRSIAGSLGTSRPTIRKYVAIAEDHGYQVGGSPPPGGWRAFFQEAAPEVFDPGLGSTIFAELRSRHDDIKEPLAHTIIMTAWQRLRDDETGIRASYSSFRRYVMKHLPEMVEGTTITVGRDDPVAGGGGTDRFWIPGAPTAHLMVKLQACSQHIDTPQFSAIMYPSAIAVRTESRSNPDEHSAVYHSSQDSLTP